MQIELSKEQYQQLLELVYLGNWMKSSYKDELEAQDEPFDDLTNYILSFAKNEKLDNLVAYEPEFDRHLPTPELDAIVDNDIAAYDQYTFLDELVHHLAERDLTLFHTEEALKAMTNEERLEALSALMVKIEIELEANDLQNLRFVE